MDETFSGAAFWWAQMNSGGWSSESAGRQMGDSIDGSSVHVHAAPQSALVLHGLPQSPNELHRSLFGSRQLVLPHISSLGQQNSPHDCVSSPSQSTVARAGVAWLKEMLTTRSQRIIEPNNAFFIFFSAGECGILRGGSPVFVVTYLIFRRRVFGCQRILRASR